MFGRMCRNDVITARNNTGEPQSHKKCRNNSQVNRKPEILNLHRRVVGIQQYLLKLNGVNFKGCQHACGMYLKIKGIYLDDHLKKNRHEGVQTKNKSKMRFAHPALRVPMNIYIKQSDKNNVSMNE